MTRPRIATVLGVLLLCAAGILLLSGALHPGSPPPAILGGVQGITTGKATSTSPPSRSFTAASASAPSAASSLPPTPTVPASVQLAASPAQRTGEAVAFDGASNTGVLFGGTDSASKALGDTWLFGGGTWTQVHPRTSPPPRSDAAMAYNPATGHVVLVGGTSAAGAALDDTWIWDGTTWSAVATRTRPTPGVPVGLAYDASSGTLVLLTRASGSVSTVLMWTFGSGTWSERTASSGTSAGTGAAVAYDPALSRLVLVDVAGGVTRLWDGTSWSTAPGPATSVSARARLAYDPTTRQLVVVESGLAQPDTTSAYDGGAWRQVTSPVGPVSVAALMSTATGVIAFGGLSAAEDLTQAWRWSPAGWGG